MQFSKANEKDVLRRELRSLREGLDPQERVRMDEAIARRVADLSRFRGAGLVLAYLSFGSEVETRGIIRAAWGAGKTVALPWCVPGTRDMRWFEVRDFDGLVRGPLGVEEPVPDPSWEVDPLESDDALALVPGLAFDRDGFRLGYGGGFYDTFLSSFEGVAVGLCREVALRADLDELGAVDERDLPVDVVVSERRILDCGGVL